MNRRYSLALLSLIAIAACTPASAGDWPMWRCTAERSAATSESLPESLQVLWTRRYSPRQQTWDDPLNLDLMTYDRVFEPIVMDGRLFVGFNDRDKLTAFDATTGEELWSFYADGPVRMPPVGLERARLLLQRRRISRTASMRPTVDSNGSSAARPARNMRSATSG